ncbi:MAG: hypothetical protein Q7K42_02620, partial [Candidatus Diapherotrites archaeon]|nr:hypothetical protein [Candidatus Diapherotrites archaeon]
EKALVIYLEAVRTDSQVHNLRENVLVEALKNFKQTLVPKAVKKNSELNDAEELNVLVTLGASHSTVVDLVKKHPGVSVSKSFLMDNPTYVFPRSVEILQRLKRGEQISLSNPNHKLMLARALIASAIPKLFLGKNYSKNFVRVAAALSVLVKKLSLEDAQFVCENFSKGARNALEKVLAPKGIPIPDSLEAVDDILAHSILAERFGLKRKFRGRN